MPQLYIDIEARFAKFQDGLNAIDRETRRVTGSLGAAFRGLQATIGAFAVKQVFSELTTHALEAEQVVNKLNAALRSTGLAAGRSVGQIESIVDELVRSTQFDDEGIREAAASLIRFRDIQRETFDETIKLAPDVAAALGVDIVSAAEQLGKALIDPGAGMRSLALAGINLSESQKEVAKNLAATGDLAGAQRVVLDSVRASVGGLAKEVNTGLLRATSDLKKSWDDLLEAIGSTPAFTSSVESSLGNLSTLFKDLESVVLGADGALAKFGSDSKRFSGEAIVAPFKALLGTFDNLSLAGNRLFNPAYSGKQSVSGKIKFPPGQSPEELGAAARDAQRMEDALIEIGRKNLEAVTKGASKRGGGGTIVSDGQRLIEQLNDRIQREKDLTELQEFEENLARGKYRIISDGEVEAARALAMRLDTLKESKRLEMERIEGAKQYVAALREHFGPMEEELRGLQRQNEFYGLTASQISVITQSRLQDALATARQNGASEEHIKFLERELNLRSQITDTPIKIQVKDIASQTKEVDSAVRDLGLTFSSAFEDAITGGKSFRDILKGIESDILRIVTRKLVTEPLANSLTSSLGKLDTGEGFVAGLLNSFKSIVPSFDVGTDFVPRDTLAFVHRGERIVPAAQNNGAMGISVTNNFAISGPVDRSTQTQIAAAAGLAVRRALARNG